jgi:cytochrome c oxidase subunit 4
MPHERTIATRTYVIVCGVLIALTVLTVGVSFIPLPTSAHVAAGLTIGVIKAALVALFFMHLLLSPKVTWMVVTVGGFWLGILMVLTLIEYASRNLIPYAPGH